MNMFRIPPAILWIIVLVTNGFSQPAQAADLTITDTDPTLIYNDTSFAGNEWLLHGHQDAFNIHDADNGKDRLRITAADTPGLIWLQSDGSVNLSSVLQADNTYNRVAINAHGIPDSVLHLQDESPRITFEETDAAGFITSMGLTSTRFDIAGAFTVALVPPAKSLNLWEDGSLGIGPSVPAAALHVKPANIPAQVLVEESSAVVAPRNLFVLKNPGNTKFRIENTHAGNAWAFTNSGMDFRISLQDSGVIEFRVNNAGDAFLDGTLTQNSDVHAKQAIVSIQPEAILERVAALPVSQWQYKDTPGVNHIGPMAQDFHAAFGLGATDKGISSLDTGGVALAAIQALKADNDRLKAQNSDMLARLEALERAMQRVPLKASTQ